VRNASVLYLFEDYVLDTARRELRRRESLVPVEPKVFDLLVHLISSRERVVSKDDLIAAIWGGRIVSESALTSCVNAARAAIGDSGDAQRLIKTLPRKGVRFVGRVAEDVHPSVQTSKVVLALPAKPSVAVLPFTNMCDDPGQEYFADGITDDIITELSRFSDLFVVARHSTFQYKGKLVDVRQVGRELGVHYVLEGSIRRNADRIRIVAQLVDAVTGTHRWAERYDRVLDDVFVTQSEVARTIVALLSAHVNKAEAERTLLKPPATWQAYDYYMRAADTFNSHWSSLNVQDLYETRRLLEHSLSIDPNYARAYAMLSLTYTTAWFNPFDADHLALATLDRAHQLAIKGVQLDPNLSQGRAQLGCVLANKGRHEAAIAEFERAIVLNANYSDGRFVLCLVLAGEATRAIEVSASHMRLDPFYVPWVPSWMGLACYMLERYSEALPLLRECVSRAPNYLAGHVWLAAAYAQLGLLQEARTEAAEVLRIEPSYTIERTPAIMSFKRSRDADLLRVGLRKAGLPKG